MSEDLVINAAVEDQETMAGFIATVKRAGAAGICVSIKVDEDDAEVESDRVVGLANQIKHDTGIIAIPMPLKIEVPTNVMRDAGGGYTVVVDDMPLSDDESNSAGFVQYVKEFGAVGIVIPYSLPEDVEPGWVEMLFMVATLLDEAYGVNTNLCGVVAPKNNTRSGVWVGRVTGDDGVGI